MGKERLAAFSDGVLAIIITIMVLELRVPEGAGFAALRPMLPMLGSYVLSFIYIGIYWNNHHHLLSATERINGKVMWANMHLLFWLSLVPLATEWTGHYPFAAAPTAVYGGLLLAASVAYWLLQKAILKTQGTDSVLGAALGKNSKGKLSPVLYALAIVLAFVSPLVSAALYIAVALMWLVPDRRIEDAVAEPTPPRSSATFPKRDGEEVVNNNSA